ncbi:unnamed protein product [Phytomonas sp. Hart1]|nr:unnamed protein product [Phytomonas sp. Hart1]|eukprot:CCW67769.1 unnamed protein product [Phytomonas sp. isolate Hart1]
MNVDTNGFTGNQRFSTNFPRPSRNGNQSKRIDKSTPLKAGEGRNLVLSCNSPHSCAAPSRAPHDHVTSSHNLGDGNRAAPHAKRPHRPRQRKTLEQVLAILQCTLRRFRRSKWFMILEVVVPILFAIALIFLDVKLGTGDIVEQSHLTLDDLVYFYYSQTTRYAANTRVGILSTLLWIAMTSRIRNWTVVGTNPRFP